ncbi:OmpP1/FadL family transporter [Shinella zoogloeoides]|uniref:OmpP1/FadL family transporter n=1 Tax=Shinella zoogloeoides TaxID=352475 RepID=UPI0013C32D09|nr:outer membrane protein transport protein [Shinella zoogloeoides]
MIGKIFKNGILAAVALAALASTAEAGGYSRGEADTDILFESGDFIFRAGATYVSPRRTFKTTGGTANHDGVYSNDYWIPSVAAKIGISENFACALTYTQPFGADATYGPDARSKIADPSKRYSDKGFETNEFGTTCDVKLDVGAGKLHLLGGVFIQDFTYDATAESPAPALLNAKLHIEDNAAYGYRIGAAYEITEYALRVSLMYRSQVKHQSDEGYLDVSDSVLPPLPVGSYSASGYGTMPQSLKLSAQTGVAPGWLVYGSAKWTDWSVLDALNYRIGGSDKKDVYNWKDGWTVQAGVAHVFNEKLTGTINLTWDSGVSTGADIHEDSVTLGAGVLAKVGPGDLRFGAGVTHMSTGSQSTTQGAAFNATGGGGWAYGVTGSYKISF